MGGWWCLVNSATLSNSGAVVGWGGFSLVMESLLFRGLKNGVRSRPDAVSRIQFKVGIERGSILKKVKKFNDLF